MGVCDDGVGGGREGGEDGRDEVGDQVEAAVDGVLVEDAGCRAKYVKKEKRWLGWWGDGKRTRREGAKEEERGRKRGTNETLKTSVSSEMEEDMFCRPPVRREEGFSYGLAVEGGKRSSRKGRKGSLVGREGGKEGGGSSTIRVRKKRRFLFGRRFESCKF